MDLDTQIPNQPPNDPQPTTPPAVASSTQPAFNPNISFSQAVPAPQPVLASQSIVQPASGAVPSSPAAPLPRVQPQPPVTGPVVGGVMDPQFSSSASNAGLPDARTKLKVALVALAALLFVGGGLTGYFLFIKDADLKQAMKTSDAFIKALDEGDEEMAKDSSVLNPRMGIQSGDVKTLAEAMSTDMIRHKQEYADKDGKKRALATYEVRTKVFNTEIVRVWINLLEKRQGKWVVVNAGTVKDKNDVKLTDFSDKVFSGDEDIFYYGSEENNEEAQDIERETDIRAMHGQLEGFYAQNGYYPTQANMNDKSFRSANMKGLDDEALRDPEGNNGQLGSVPAARTYAYQPTTRTVGACDNDANFCETYILTATRADGSEYTKESLN